jgi:hypothetical protein
MVATSPIWGGATAAFFGRPERTSQVQRRTDIAVPNEARPDVARSREELQRVRPGQVVGNDCAPPSPRILGAAGSSAPADATVGRLQRPRGRQEFPRRTGTPSNRRSQNGRAAPKSPAAAGPSRLRWVAFAKIRDGGIFFHLCDLRHRLPRSLCELRWMQTRHG